MKDSGKIFVAFAILCIIVGVATLLSVFVHWSLGIGGVAALLLGLDFFNLSNKEKDK